MTDEEFEKWLLNLGCSEEVQQMIRFNRNAPPARQVRSSSNNVVVKYSCPKNGESLPLESKLELACCLTRLARDRDVLEYRSQCPIYTVNYKNKAGKQAGHQKICDFFVMRRHGVEMIECKPEEILEKLSAQNPELYKKKSDGGWSCPPGEAFAQSYGFTFTVFSSSDVNFKAKENADLLFDYYVDDLPPVPPDVEERIISIVSAQVGITYYTLTQKHEINPDHLNMLIATNKIYFDFEKELLADTKEAHLYVDEAAAKEHVVRDRGISSHLQDVHTINIAAGEKIKWNEEQWTIVSFDSTHVTLYAENGSVIKPKLAAIEELVRQGEIIGLGKALAKSDADKKYDEFYRRASKKEWKILKRRQALWNSLNTDKGGSSDVTG